MNRRLLFPALIVILAGAVILWRIVAPPPKMNSGTNAAVRSVVTEFGKRLNSVSLLSSKDDLRRQIRATYAPYVTGELLSAWLDNPKSAPGRLTSSPWPDRIEIDGIESRDGTYEVSGSIVLMTSVETTSAEADNAGTRPVTITVVNVNGRWLISAFEVKSTKQSDATTYSGTDNAFRITYPRDAYSAFGPGQEDIERSGHYIPPCEDGFAACIAFSADTFHGTNFGSAGVGIFVTDAENQEDCAATEHGALRRNAHSEIIGGQEFTVFDSGTAAMSHVAQDTVYLRWQNDSCYKLVSRIAFSRFEVYEPGTIDEFTDESMQHLQGALHAIVSTFEFRGDTPGISPIRGAALQSLRRGCNSFAIRPVQPV